MTPLEIWPKEVCKANFFTCHVWVPLSVSLRDVSAYLYTLMPERFTKVFRGNALGVFSRPLGVRWIYSTALWVLIFIYLHIQLSCLTYAHAWSYNVLNTCVAWLFVCIIVLAAVFLVVVAVVVQRCCWTNCGGSCVYPARGSRSNRVGWRVVACNRHWRFAN